MECEYRLLWDYSWSRGCREQRPDQSGAQKAIGVVLATIPVKVFLRGTQVLCTDSAAVGAQA